MIFLLGNDTKFFRLTVGSNRGIFFLVFHLNSLVKTTDYHKAQSEALAVAGWDGLNSLVKAIEVKRKFLH